MNIEEASKSEDFDSAQKSRIFDIKQELMKQAEQLPEDTRQSFIEKIEGMSEQELQDFLKQLAQNQKSSKGNGCIFCSIVKGKISSMKITETKNFVAVLDINPASEGHLLIIPRKHVESFEKLGNKSELTNVIEELSKKIKKELNALDVAVLISSAGHLIIQLIPIYEDTILQFPRKKFEREKMEEIADKIRTEIKETGNNDNGKEAKGTKSKKVENGVSGAEIEAPKPETSKSKDFDSFRTKCSDSARNSSEFRHAQKSHKISDKLEKRPRRIP